MTVNSKSELNKWITEFDHYVNSKFDRVRKNKFLFSFAEILSFMGDYGLVWVLVAVVALAKKPKESFKIIKVLAFSGIGSVLFSSALKVVFNRKRPNGSGPQMDNVATEVSKGSDEVVSGFPKIVRARWLRMPNSNSFPSGHTIAAFATAYLFENSVVKFKWLKLLALLIGISRIIVNDHYPSDVVAGSIIGVYLARVGEKYLKVNS